jgi:hypothetical protein
LSNFQTLGDEVLIFLKGSGNSFGVGIVEGCNPSVGSLLEGLGGLSVSLKGGCSLSVSGFVGSGGLLLNKLGSGVQLEESVVVGQRVLLSIVNSSLSCSLDNGLDFIRVDNSSDISVTKDGSLQLVS